MGSSSTESAIHGSRQRIIGRQRRERDPVIAACARLPHRQPPSLVAHLNGRLQTERELLARIFELVGKGASGT